MSHATPPDEHRRVYAARSRQLLLAAGLLAVYLSTVSLIWEPDPDTGIRPAPGDYLPIVIPGTILLLYLLWRALKARVETTDGGIGLYRVVGREWFGWSDVRGFEVLPSPSRRGATVRLRQQNETLVTVRSELSLRPLRDRDERRRRARQRAESFQAALEADRLERLASYQPADPREQAGATRLGSGPDHADPAGLAVDPAGPADDPAGPSAPAAAGSG